MDSIPRAPEHTPRLVAVLHRCLAFLTQLIFPPLPADPAERLATLFASRRPVTACQDVYIEAFRELRQSHRPDEARELAELGCKLHPEKPVFAIQLGHALLAQENWDAAEQHWAAMRRTDPDCHPAYLYGAVTRIRQLNHLRAAELLEPLVRMRERPDWLETELARKVMMLDRCEVAAHFPLIAAYAQKADLLRRYCQVQNSLSAAEIPKSSPGNPLLLGRLKSSNHGWLVPELGQHQNAILFPQLAPTHKAPGNRAEHILYSENGHPIIAANHFKSGYLGFREHSWHSGTSEKTERLERPALYGGRLMTHFGHFILETLPRLWPLLSHPAACEDRVVCFSAYHGLAAQPCPSARLFDSYHRSYLRALGLHEDRVRLITGATRLDDVIVSGPATALSERDCFASEQALALWQYINQQLGRQADPSALPRNCERIYISRRKVRNPVDGRVLRNEEQLEKVFAHYGFAIIYPEDLPSEREKHAILSQAKYIAGGAGSGLLNSVFARCDARVLCIASDQTMKTNPGLNHQVAFCHFKGQESYLYVQDTANCPGTLEWEIDTRAIAEVIEQMLEG